MSAMEQINDAALDVSVIFPIYNAERYVTECVRGIACQTLRNIEIICVDDGSTDGTGALLDDLACEDDRIVVVHKANGGAGSARNAGLAVARGQYLSLLDIDDVYEPDMLEKAINAAQADNLDVVVFRSDECFVDEKVYKGSPWTIHEELLPSQRPFAGIDVERDVFKLFVGWSWDKLFKTSFIRENNLSFQEIRTTNDMLFVFSAIVRAGRIGVMDDVLAHHRKESGTLSATREKSWGCFYEALCALRDQLRSWGLYERFERDYINYCVHASLWNVRTLSEPTKTLLKQKLAQEWYTALGVTAHEASYFYNQGEFNDYREICGYKPPLSCRVKRRIKKILKR